MKTTKQTTLNIKLTGDEIKNFKSMIEKVADSENAIRFNSKGLTAKEREIVDKLKEDL